MNRFMEMNHGGGASNLSNSSLFGASGASDSNEADDDGESNGMIGAHLHFSVGNNLQTSNKPRSLFPMISPSLAWNRTTTTNNNNIFAQRNLHSTNSTNSSPAGFSDGDLQNERIVAPDFSIFNSPSSYDLEPIPMDVHRNPRHQAALQSMLKESVDFLFGKDKQKAAPPDKIDGSDRRKRKREGSPNEDELEQMRYTDPERFRLYQAEQWDQRLEDLHVFRRIHGHCSVPYDYSANRALARWVKRQRYQYKLFHEGESSAMTERRIAALEAVGFVWDTYTAAWERRISELRAYKAENGNCNVPATYRANKKLAAWVKCQRRQYKLFKEGLPSTLTQERIDALNEMCFFWELRSNRGNS